MAKKFIFALLLVVFISPVQGQVANEAEVRATVQRVFQQLKSRDYSSLYDVLPASSRNRMSRTRFIDALKRAQDMYVLERMEVGAVRVANDLAVVDTVLYGHVNLVNQTEGKIVVQQYLVREGGQWRVATGDSGTIKRFLANNPSFAKRFPIRRPKIYLKRDGGWTEFTPPQMPKT